MRRRTVQGFVQRLMVWTWVAAVLALSPAPAVARNTMHDYSIEFALESATQFRCAAGNVVANVVLTGRVVRLSK